MSRIIIRNHDDKELFATEIADAETRSSFANLGLAVVAAVKTGVNLTGAVLPGVKLAGTELARVNFTGANLARADLAMANLNKANFFGANLYRATLAEAFLFGADFREAHLIGTNLKGAGLINANFIGTTLVSTHLHGAHLAGSTLFHGGARSDGYNFYGQIQNNTLWIKAGCRYFTLDEARKHWKTTRRGTLLGEESLAILDHLERMARIRGMTEEDAG